MTDSRRFAAMTRGAFVGIDVAVAKPMDIAVVDADLRSIALERCNGPEAAAACVIRHWPDADVAVDSPPGHNLGLVPGRNYRTGEWELVARGLSLYPTPREDAQPWMQAGFRLFDLLKRAGWRHFEGELLEGKVVCEFYPHAAFCSLAGGFIPKKDRPEGRKRRLELLEKAGVEGDLQGLTADQVDALAGALTAWHLREGKAAWYGDPREGVLVTPTVLWEPGGRPTTNC